MKRLDWLYKIRQDKGLTLKEADRACGLKAAVYSTIENGLRRDMEAEKQIAAGLGFSIERWGGNGR